MKILCFLLLACAVAIPVSHGQTLLSGTPSPNGQVYDIERIGDMIYIGGSFTQVNGQPRVHLARFNANTGVLDAWNPTLSASGTPHARSLTRVGSKLVVGGHFMEVNSQPRQFIAVFDHATGNLEDFADPSITSWSTGVGADGNNFYYVNATTNIFQGFVKCADATTGTNTGWQSQYEVNGDVNAIGVLDNYVYVGGQFSLSGGPAAYNSLCRFDKATGTLDLTWQPEVHGGNFGVTQLVPHDGKMWVGFTGDSIAGALRKGIASFNTDGTLTAFNQYSSSYEVFAIFPKGDHVFVGGNSSTLGGQLRWRIAEINMANSMASCWNAAANTSGWSFVNSIYATGDTVWVGPGFGTLVAFVGSPRPHIDSSDIAGPVNVTPSQMATYTAPDSAAAGYTYWWEIVGGTGTSTTNSIDVTWGTGPTGLMKFVAKNPGGGSNCIGDTAILHITIGPNGLGNALPDAAFDVFPNPAFSNVQLTGLTANALVEVVDVTGRICLRQVLRKELSLDLTSVQPGVYLIKSDGHARRLVKL